MTDIIGSPTAGTPSPNAGNGWIKDGSIETFEQDVIAASMEVPVIVDFWASWCGPCKQLIPALEKVVTDACGTVRLVKIDIDKNQMLATQLRVQSVPTVYAFFQGQPVDGFMGAVPESELKAFLARLEALAQGNGAKVPEGEVSAAQMIEAAGEALNKGDLSSAAQLYAHAVQTEPENVDAIAGLARCYLALGEVDQAKALIDSVPEDKKSDTAIRSVVAAMELSQGGSDVSDQASLARRIETNPDDHEARYNLATAQIADGQMEFALDHLLILLEKDREWNDEAARKKILTLFEALGPTHPLVKTGRRRMSSVLFS